MGRYIRSHLLDLLDLDHDELVYLGVDIAVESGHAGAGGARRRLWLDGRGEGVAVCLRETGGAREGEAEAWGGWGREGGRSAKNDSVSSRRRRGNLSLST
jgi:hypothetical protein